MPVTVRRAIELLGLIGVGMIVSQGKQVVMPLLLAFLLSIVMLPVYRFFKRIKFPDVLAVALTVLILLAILGGFVWLFSVQLSKLFADFPEIKKNIVAHVNHLSDWISDKTHVSTREQMKLVNEQSEKMLDSTGDMLSKTLDSITGVLIYVGLIPIYIFLILIYKNLLLRFVFLWFPEDEHRKVRGALSETESIIKRYLLGLIIQITYITVLLGGTLALFGIKHALLIGIIFAFLNLIPYVGALVAVIISVLLTLSSTEELTPVLIVLATIGGVQFLDNNILMPRIVGSKVRINALASIGGVFIGGALAGVPGMFLSIPTLATMKVIFDRTKNLSQWGVLLGDDVPKESPMNHKAEGAPEHPEEEKKDSPPEEKKKDSPPEKGNTP